MGAANNVAVGREWRGVVAALLSVFFLFVLQPHGLRETSFPFFVSVIQRVQAVHAAKVGKGD